LNIGNTFSSSSLIKYLKNEKRSLSTETVRRKFGAYDSVKDNYPKYVLSLDDFDFSQKGIIHKNVIKWLLEET
jgi:hypothetical protein